MIDYPHFAFDNLFLTNGYHESTIDDDVVYEYDREEELEQCIRRLVLRKPEPLRGWDLRFLRRGLELSQADFGKMVDRDAQTVARWEKSKELVPKFVDLMIRARFAERFEPELATKLLSFIDGTAPPLPKKITLSLSKDGWNFAIAHEEFKVLGTSTVVNAGDFDLTAFYARLAKANTPEVVLMHSVGATTEETDLVLWPQDSARTKPALSAIGRKHSIHFTPGNC